MTPENPALSAGRTHNRRCGVTSDRTIEETKCMSGPHPRLKVTTGSDTPVCKIKSGYYTSNRPAFCPVFPSILGCASTGAETGLSRVPLHPRFRIVLRTPV